MNTCIDNQNIKFDKKSWTLLLELMCLDNKYEMGSKVFDTIKKVKQLYLKDLNEKDWCCILNCYNVYGSVSDIINEYEYIKACNIPLNGYILKKVLQSMIQRNDTEFVQTICHDILDNSIQINNVILQLLMVAIDKAFTQNKYNEDTAFQLLNDIWNYSHETIKINIDISCFSYAIFACSKLPNNADMFDKLTHIIVNRLDLIQNLRESSNQIYFRHILTGYGNANKPIDCYQFYNTVMANHKLTTQDIIQSLIVLIGTQTEPAIIAELLHKLRYLDFNKLTSHEIKFIHRIASKLDNNHDDIKTEIRQTLLKDKNISNLNVCANININGTNMLIENGYNEHET